MLCLYLVIGITTDVLCVFLKSVHNSVLLSASSRCRLSYYTEKCINVHNFKNCSVALTSIRKYIISSLWEVVSDNGNLTILQKPSWNFNFTFSYYYNRKLNNQLSSFPVSLIRIITSLFIFEYYVII